MSPVLLGAGLLVVNLFLALLVLSSSESYSALRAGILFISPLIALVSIVLAGVLLSPLSGIGPLLLLSAVLLAAMLSIFFAFSVLGEESGGHG